jgi:Lon protease-like protein
MSDARRPRDPFDPSFESLPATLPIFPLSGAMLLPGGRLPLTIFEPRYLAMTFDALRGSRMIGMVQPNKPGGFAGDGKPEPGGGLPPVHRIGCAGRIVSFEETGDGRLGIALGGVCRFEIAHELPLADGGYRVVTPDWTRFRGDLDVGSAPVDVDRAVLVGALKAFARRRKLSIDWKALEGAPDSMLVGALSMALPFGPSERQALLEAADGTARGKLLQAFLQMATDDPDGDAEPVRH